MKSSGLGKGLRSLIPSKPSKFFGVGSSETKQDKENVFYVEVDKIKPNQNQPRRDFDEGSLKELASSVKEYGVLQPLIVTRVEKELGRGKDVEYELIAGERRLRAAQMAGLPHVPVVIRESSGKEKLEVSLVENIQRADLNPVEEALAFKRLAAEFGLTQKDIAVRVSKSREAVANTIRLLDLPMEIQKAIEAGKISAGHAKAILMVPNPEKQRAFYQFILDNRLNVRAAEETAGRFGNVQTRPRKAVILDPQLKNFQQKLEEILGTKITIQNQGNGGKLIIKFYSSEDLEQIIKKIGV